MKLAPSILAADFTCLGAQIAEVEQADQIHIDVMDGVFVPQISFGLPIIRAARQATSLPLDVHLMVVNPERHLAAVAEAGANYITLHIEATAHPHAALQAIKGLGCRAGIALNPHTPAMMVSELLPLADLIVVLAVNPGAGGQAFLPQTLPKIAALARMIQEAGRPIDLLVDGGVNFETAPSIQKAGATMLVAGTAIFKGNIRDNLQHFRTRIQGD